MGLRLSRGMMLAVALAVLMATACDSGPKVAYKELADSDPHVRADAARRLGDARATDAVQSLIAVLDDPSEEVRVTSIIALGEIGDPAAIPALAQLVNDPTPSVRLQISQTFGVLADAGGIEPLSRLMYDADETIRISSARSLGMIGTPEAVKVLVDVALLDESEMVRQHVIKVVGAESERQFIPRVESSLIAESDIVRANAARVLGVLGDSSSVPVLIEALDDPFFKVRSLSAHSLAEIAPDDGEVVEAMKKRLAVEEEGMVRVDLAWAIAKAGDRSHIDVLRNLLFHGQPEDVRAEAAMALGEVGDKSDIPLLERAINDKKGLVRKQAHLAAQKLKEA